MTEATLQQAWQVRPPWPDELTRIITHFPLRSFRANTRRVWMWVLVAGPLERIAGIMNLAEDDASPDEQERPPIARLDFSIRDRWPQTDAAHALLQAALNQATELGLHHHTCQADPSGSFAHVLHEAGFTHGDVKEVWNSSVGTWLDTCTPLLNRMLQRYPVKVMRLEESHLEAVRRICLQLDLLPPERVRLANPAQANDQGIDARLSAVAGDPANPAGVALARVLNGKLYIDVLARNPDAPSASPALVGALLKTIVTAAREMGLEDALCAMRSKDSEGVASLMQRGGGQCVQRFALFVLDRKSPAASL